MIEQQTAASEALAPMVIQTPASRDSWDAAMRTFREIKAEEAAFMPAWWEAHKKCDAECEALPHITLRPDPYSGRTNPVTTADTRFVARARREVMEVDTGKAYYEDIPSLQEHLQLCREVAKAADERDRQLQAIREKYAMDEADAKAEELGDAIADAQSLLMDLPAPDLAALRWKLEQLRESDGDMVPYVSSYVQQCFEDVARLLPEPT